MLVRGRGLGSKRGSCRLRSVYVGRTRRRRSPGECPRRHVSDAFAEWDRIHGDAPDLLYHHIEVAGLIGICSSRSLWAKNQQFMNDSKELAHWLKLMLDVLAESKARARLPAQLESSVGSNERFERGLPAPKYPALLWTRIYP